MNPEIRYLPSNAHGRDFVLGDLHGEADLLLEKLRQLDFDPAHDRVFSVGDLIDRGQDSPRALDLLEQPWFYAVLGNHEAMMIDATLHQLDLEQWLSTGGQWSREMPANWLYQQARRLARLPHIMVVGEGERRFNIVHAALMDFDGRQLSDAELDDPQRLQQLDIDTLIWSRLLARDYWKFLQGKAAAGPAWHEGLSLTFCGHTPVARPGLLRSHYFLDGGSGYAPVPGYRCGEPYVVDAMALLAQLRNGGSPATES